MTPDPQQLHLWLNHIPVVGAWWTLGVCLIAGARPSLNLRRLACAFSLVLTLSIVAAFVTGEPAEEKVEHLPGVVESNIESHEDLARVALGLGLVLGVTSLIGLVADPGGKPGTLAFVVTVLLVLVTGIVMLLVGHHGGRIHRPELG